MKSKSKAKAKTKSRYKPVLAIVICLMVTVTIFPRVKTICQLSTQKHQLEQEKTRLERIHKQKKAELKQLDQPATIEKIAREQLGMVKYGEKPVREIDQQ